MTSSRTQLKILRLAQLSMMSSQDIDAIIQSIRQVTTLARLDYHFESHGEEEEFETSVSEEYRALFRSHLRCDDLRIFTYLRSRGRAILGISGS